MEDDSEIVLYADLNAKGEFKGPFRIYEIDGRRIVESEENKKISAEKQYKEYTLEECVKGMLKKFLVMVNEKMPELVNFISRGSSTFSVLFLLHSM